MRQRRTLAQLTDAELLADLELYATGPGMDSEVCLFCGCINIDSTRTRRVDRNELTTGWLPVVGGVWKCEHCQSKYDKYRRLIKPATVEEKR